MDPHDPHNMPGPPPGAKTENEILEQAWEKLAGESVSYREDMKELIGKTIADVRMNPARDQIAFDIAGITDTPVMCFTCEGDCCSRSWIEHLEGVDALRGGKVTFVRVTDRAVFEFRNESNGYYSGWCSLREYTVDCPECKPVQDY